MHSASSKFAAAYKQSWQQKNGRLGKMACVYRMVKKSELLKMMDDPTTGNGKATSADTALLVKEAVGTISSRVRKKYSLIKPESIPDHVNYAKIEKYLRSVNIEVTRKMFATYIKEQLLPSGHVVKNSNFSLYTHEQILYYILVDMFKPILPLGKIKVLFREMLQPMIDIIGLNATYIRLCENILLKMDSFETAVALAVQNDMQTVPQPDSQTKNTQDAVLQAIGSIAYYTQVETLCLAKGALDFFEQTPDNPLT